MIKATITIGISRVKLELNVPFDVKKLNKALLPPSILESLTTLTKHQPAQRPFACLGYLCQKIENCPTFYRMVKNAKFQHIWGILGV